MTSIDLDTPPAVLFNADGDVEKMEAAFGPAFEAVQGKIEWISGNRTKNKNDGGGAPHTVRLYESQMRLGEEKFKSNCAKVAEIFEMPAAEIEQIIEDWARGV